MRGLNVFNCDDSNVELVWEHLSCPDGAQWRIVGNLKRSVTWRCSEESSPETQHIRRVNTAHNRDRDTGSHSEHLSQTTNIKGVMKCTSRSVYNVSRELILIFALCESTPYQKTFPLAETEALLWLADFRIESVGGAKQTEL